MSLTFVSLLEDPFYLQLLRHVGLTEYHLPTAATLQGLRSGEIDVAAMCGLLFAQHSDWLEVLAIPVPLEQRYQNQTVYYSDIVVRHEHPAQTLRDLQHASWVFNQTESFSGWLALLHHLEALSPNVGYFRHLTQSGSHLASLAYLRDGLADATAVDSLLLEAQMRRDPSLRGQFRVIESLGPYPIAPLVVRRDLPETVKTALRQELLQLHQHRFGQEVLFDGGYKKLIDGQQQSYRQIQQIAHDAYANQWRVLRAA